MSITSSQPFAKPVDSIIRKRANSICHFQCLAGNSTVIFSTIQPFLFANSLLAVDRQLLEMSCSHAGMQGNIADNMYPIPVVYQRIFNKLIQVLY